MRFGSWMLSGYLMDAAGEGGGGGGGAQQPPPVVDMKALAALVADTVKNTVAATFDARDKAAKAEADRQAEEARKAAEAEEARKAAEAAANGNHGGGSGSGGGNGSGGESPEALRLKVLEKQLKQLTEQNAEERRKRQETEQQSLERDRVGSIKGELAKIPWAKPENLDIAFTWVERQIKRGDDGKYYGPDGTTPLGDYVSTLMETTFDSLVSPRQTGGSGASGASGAGGARGGFQIEDIRPGAKNLDAIREHIAQQVRQLTGR